MREIEQKEKRGQVMMNPRERKMSLSESEEKEVHIGSRVESAVSHEANAKIVSQELNQKKK